MGLDTEFKTPGQLIDKLLSERDWTQKFLAFLLDVSEDIVSRIIVGKRPVDAEMALRLGEAFNTDPERFLRLQQRFDLNKANIVRIPDPARATRAELFGELRVPEMIRRNWLDVDDPNDMPAVEKELMRFFNAPSLDQIEVLRFAAKQTKTNIDPTPVQVAWLRRVTAIAKDILVPRKYTEFLGRKAVKEMQDLIYAPSEARKVPRILIEAGIRFVIVEGLPTAGIDGVCFWLDDNSPVIALTMRFDRNDNFWFVVRHECEHVLKGHGKQDDIYIVDNLEGSRAGTGPDIEEEERMANEAAAEFCVPKKKMDKFVAVKAPFFSEKDLLGFAKTIKVHPGIVAGRLQYETGRYDRFRNHQVKMRSIITPNAYVDGWGNVYPLEK
ncbi:MAG TPA: HigA family addiction module antitoxin [Pyrinomonadaceae bacterium]|nr:HigA family addiction module antitoxin [Pyrinomonadaceae bacterium]